jgi:Co/Zn/Cd efflux system component
LLRATSAVLLDRSASPERCAAVRERLESDGARVVDLHLWCIGLDLYSLTAVVVAPEAHPPDHYKKLLPREPGIVHATIEVHVARGSR